MALTKQQKDFAELILRLRPERLSNRELALRLGAGEAVASATGSRLMASAEVRSYILSQWEDYFSVAEQQKWAKKDAKNRIGLDKISVWLAEEASEEHAKSLLKQILAAHPHLQPAQEADAASVKAYILGLDKGSEHFGQIVRQVCGKLGCSTEPLDYWDSVLIDPFASSKEKMMAADSKAKYTKARPTSNKKEDSLALAQSLREQRRQTRAVGDLFGSASDAMPSADGTGYRNKLPKWN